MRDEEIFFEHLAVSTLKGFALLRTHRRVFSVYPRPGYPEGFLSTLYPAVGRRVLSTLLCAEEIFEHRAVYTLMKGIALLCTC